MSEYPYVASQLFWKFVASDDRHGSIWWRWEVWTQAGQYVTTSTGQYETLSECVADARMNGYVPPEKRLK